MIRIDDITLGYGCRTLIEHGSAEIGRGELVALVGRNGSGKSTLLRALSGIERPRQGRISVSGEDIYRLGAVHRARLISTVTTERVRVANMRCRDVVAAGRAPYTDWIGRFSDDDRRAVDEALARVGISGFAERKVDTLSDGERQRVMIARALAQATPVILLDEPTSFLDVPNRYEMCALLSELAHEQGKAIVFSTHELEIAMRYADRMAVIDTPALRMSDVSVAAGLIERVFGVSGNLNNFRTI